MNDELAEPPGQRRRLRPATILLIASGLFIVLLALGFCGGLYLSDRQIKTELAKMRAAGEPITLADLDAFYSLPADSRDATDLWMAAVADTESKSYQADAGDLMSGNFRNLMPNRNEPWPEHAAAEQFLEKHSDTLRKVHEAAAMGGAARFPTDFVNDPTLVKIGQFQLKLTLRISALLLLESKVHAHRGNAHAAAEAVHASFALARSTECCPLLGSFLFQISRDATSIDCFERLLSVVEISETDLATIDRDLATINYREGFHRAMLGERVATMQVFGHPDVLGGQRPFYGKLSVFRQADFAVYLQLMGEFATASKAPNALLLRAAMDGAQERANEFLSAPGASWRYRMTTLLNPFFEHIADSVCRGTVKRDLAQLAIAVERFRRLHGQLPGALDEVVPDFIASVPVDPFSGGSLKWCVADSECRIYSVGPDGADQEGADERPDAAGDIVFRLAISRDEESSPGWQRARPLK